MSIEMWKSKKGRIESEKLFFMVERAILPFVLIKYARFVSQDLNDPAFEQFAGLSESAGQYNLHNYVTTQ